MVGKVARFAVLAHEVPQRRSARFNRVMEYLFDAVGKVLITRQRYPPRRALRVNPAEEQRLVCVDVAEAGDDTAIHKKTLDVNPSCLGKRVQVSAGKIVAKRFRPQVAQELMSQRVFAGPQNTAETPRVVKT